MESDITPAQLEKLAQQMIELRKACRLSQRQLDENMGFARGMVCQYEKTRFARMSYERLVKLYRYLYNFRADQLIAQVDKADVKNCY